jgi:hypothetical protein
VAVNKLERGLILLEVGKEVQVPAGHAVIVEIDIHLSSKTKRVDIICALIGQEKPTLVTLSSRSVNILPDGTIPRDQVLQACVQSKSLLEDHTKSQRARRSYPSRTQHRKPAQPDPGSEPDRSEPTLSLQTPDKVTPPVARKQNRELKQEIAKQVKVQVDRAMKVAVAEIASTQRSHSRNHPRSRSGSTSRSELSGSRSRSRPRAHHDNGLLHRLPSRSRGRSRPPSHARSRSRSPSRLRGHRHHSASSSHRHRRRRSSPSISPSSESSRDHHHHEPSRHHR